MRETQRRRKREREKESERKVDSGEGRRDGRDKTIRLDYYVIVYA